MAHILLIDDDAILKETFGALMGRLGHRLTWAGSLEAGRAALSQGRFDVVLLDLRLPDGYGLDMMPEVRAAPGTPEIIIVTAQDDPEGAALAIKSGAWDYIQKPLTPARVTLPLTRALEYRAQKAARRPRAVLKREGIIGAGPAMEACLDLVAQAADSDASVLLTGETGTGKELFARAIHAKSSRATNNFVVVDCAALPETLVESVLFGHVKGAFTGADRDRDGLVTLADGGTLFLDEIGELSPAIQKTFLRVLQDGRFRPVGSKNELQSDFRLVAATNRDLPVMAAGGMFREDLLYRLRTIVITLPPLRLRTEDIRALALHYMNRLCVRYRLPTKGFSDEFFQALAAYTWPGNVRELCSTMERVLLAYRGEPVLYPKHLPDEIRIPVLNAGAAGEPDGAGRATRTAAEGQPVPPWKAYRRRALDAAEEAYLRDLLVACGGTVVRAAKVSGLSVSRLYDLFRKYNLPTRA
ncbi:sigma-54 dependent transcriptional regulator [Solidesulfovibrio sp.]|uniref:sigma-54-dependent transcriptional regulator n=1 Tax=Solidesulfovibrio sp. TaxID=2910990 RepID=UPI002B1FB4EC|nr:sigma-54 dependent transcriptional regulator [Solidesulfovibrio sp.]MEA4855966.1 sigma-54 dependent transcriptional regulator [Solidesulfovibrio sp.]